MTRILPLTLLLLVLIPPAQADNPEELIASALTTARQELDKAYKALSAMTDNDADILQRMQKESHDWRRRLTRGTPGLLVGTAVLPGAIRVKVTYARRMESFDWTLPGTSVPEDDPTLGGNGKGTEKEKGD